MKKKYLFGAVIGVMVGYIMYLRHEVKNVRDASEYGRHHVFGCVLTVRPYGEPGRSLVMAQREDGSIFEAVVPLDFESARETYQVGEFMWVECNLA